MEATRSFVLGDGMANAMHTLESNGWVIDDIQWGQGAFWYVWVSTSTAATKLKYEITPTGFFNNVFYS
jgi:hypothetical protein